MDWVALRKSKQALEKEPGKSNRHRIAAVASRESVESSESSLRRVSRVSLIILLFRGRPDGRDGR